LLGVVTGQWGARVVPAGAALSFLAAPANSFFDLMRTHSLAFWPCSAALAWARWRPWRSISGIRSPRPLWRRAVAGC